MYKLTISLLLGLALLPMSAQAGDFDDITLQIMDADSTGQDINNVEFSQREEDMHDVVLVSKVPQGPSDDDSAATTAFDGDGNGGNDVDLPGETPTDLPPEIDGPTVEVDPGDFPEDLAEDLNDLMPVETEGPGGIGGDLPGETPSDLPPEIAGPDVDPGDFPTDVDPDDLPEGTVTY